MLTRFGIWFAATPPSMMPMSTGKKPSQAEVAQQQQVDILTTADVVTSLEASISISPNVNTLRAKVLEALRARPMTDEEGAILLVMNPSTYRPRRVELAQLGLIKKAGVTKTAANRNAQIWEAV